MTDPKRSPPEDERRSTLENLMAAVVAMLMTVSAIEVVAIMVAATNVVAQAAESAPPSMRIRSGFAPDGAGAVLMTAGRPVACAGASARTGAAPAHAGPAPATHAASAQATSDRAASASC